MTLPAEVAVLGWHWMGCATGCAPERLADPEGLDALLRELPAALGLRAVSEPVVRDAATGLAGVILLAESHVAIHVAEADRAVLIDVFSCVHFDPAPAPPVLRRALGAAHVDGSMVQRGPTGEVA